MAELIAFANQNMLLVMAFFGILIALAFNEIATMRRGYKPVSAMELIGMINRDETVVVDLRGEGEFSKGHIIESVHILPSQLSLDVKGLKNLKGRSITLVCKEGRQASIAAAKLHQNDGPDVFWLDGGVSAWTQADLPLHQGSR